MPDSPKFSPSSSNSSSRSSSRSQTSPLQANPHTCEPCEASCQQMAESQATEAMEVCFTVQPETSTFRSAVAKRNGSGSGSAPGRGSADSDHFHLYRRQLSDRVVTAGECLQMCPSSLSCLQDGFNPVAHSYVSSSKAPPTWEQNNGSIQNPYQELPAVPVESSCFLTQRYPSYCSSSPAQQVSSGPYSNNNQSSGAKYSLQSLSAQSHQENSTQPLFPKPIYSYSILIFMALKSSKTGSLPVSEIYSFMTEHFPYFKTAPDGWKNSVRHNLSLNKCFEKVENKNGTSSRKGCLWALNPAKVEKMQEELHKWRRKDPITVRRSMARPEDLDRLLGERPDKLRCLPPYSGSSLPSRVPSVYSTASSSCSPAPLKSPCQPVRRPHYTHIQPQTSCYLPPAAAHPSNTFTLSSACGQQPAAGFSSGGLNSPMAGKMLPAYNCVMQAAEYGIGPRSMQDFVLEGDASYDIDTLNPSLTDLQLQGNMWEVLGKDSLVSDPHVSTAAPSTTPALQYHHVPTSGPQVTPPVSQMSDMTPSGQYKDGYEMGDSDIEPHLDQHGCLNRLHPVVYSGVESLGGYLTSCTTTISLL